MIPMKIANALIITDDDLVDNKKGFDFSNLKQDVFNAVIITEFVFFNGALVKNRIGPI